MVLITYKDSYKDSLAELIHLYFLETNTQEYIGNINTAKEMIKQLLLQKSIYLLLDDSNSKVIGFIVTYLDSQYNMLKQYIVNEYMFVLPEYRSTKAVAYLYYMIGIIARDYNCDVIGTTYCTSSNTSNNQLVGGVTVANVFKIPLEQINKRYEKYTKRLGYV